MTVLEVADELLQESGSRPCRRRRHGSGDGRPDGGRTRVRLFGSGHGLGREAERLGPGIVVGVGIPGVVAGLGQNLALLVVRMFHARGHGTPHGGVQGGIAPAHVVAVDARHHLDAVARNAAEGGHHPRQGGSPTHHFVRAAVRVVQVDAQQSAVARKVLHGMSAPALARHHHTGRPALHSLGFGPCGLVGGQPAVVQRMFLVERAAHALHEEAERDGMRLMVPHIPKLGYEGLVVCCNKCLHNVTNFFVSCRAHYCPGP